jgi:hypothetical protein
MFPLVVTACAESVAPPQAVVALPAEQMRSLHIKTVTAEPGPGVAMTPDDLSRNSQQVLAQIRAASPNVLVTPGDTTAPTEQTMKLVFTKYDEGSAFGRFMLAGVGQIYIEADVLIIDDVTGQQLADYKVSKDFSFGGLYGGTTTIRDVEKGFAKSVAEIVKQKAAALTMLHA